MRFKNWLTENLAGPGGGPDGKPTDLEALAKNNAARGVGAFPTYGDEPPKNKKSPMLRYLDKRFYRKAMKKS